MDNVTVISDAELINEYGRKAMEGPAEKIVTQAPSQSDVQLLAGTFVEGNLTTEAEVRELNGADEEAIARAGSIGKILSTILQRGINTIGGVKATEAVLDSLLSGDRDLLLLAIRKVTFGNTIDLQASCVSCGAEQKPKIDLDRDVPVTSFDGTWFWDVPTKLGTVRVGFYNGITQKKIMDNLDKTVAELNTIILGGCIQSVDGSPIIATEFAKQLGIADRERIIKEVSEKAPGPRLLEVKKACEACGEDIYLPLSLASLFRL